MENRATRRMRWFVARGAAGLVFILKLTDAGPPEFRWARGPDGASRSTCRDIPNRDAWSIYESPWEVLLAFQMGKQACALFGSIMTPEQEKRLEPYPIIWLVLDNDDAGRVASVEIGARLRRRHKVITGFLKD